jgi:hypothetical protein
MRTINRWRLQETGPLPLPSVYLREVGRVHLFEIHDLGWFPMVWRDLLTDFLSFHAIVFKPYAGVAPLLAEALSEAGTAHIVDLCSGAGSPIVSLVPAIRRLGVPDLSVTLTDKYPNLEAFRRTCVEAEGSIDCVESAVDANDVPPGLGGFRTLFTSFHHFCPKQAWAVLEDADNHAAGIGVFEYTERNWLIWSLPVLLIPLFVWACTPFIRPFSWRRLLWTYLLPVVPIVAMWDGLVSNLRTYSVAELRELVEQIGGRRFRWRIGRVRSIGASRVTYLIGTP